MNKKKILSLALVLLLICTISFGTLAWFNAADEVTNTSYVADSDDNGTPDFDINVFEQKYDENGDIVYVDGKPAFTEEGNSYKDILPGSHLPKAAWFYNDGDYSQWVRVHVTFSDSAVWQQAFAKAAAHASVADWRDYVVEHVLSEPLSGNYEDNYEVNYNEFGLDTLTFTFYYKDKVAPNTGNIKILSEIVIPNVLEQEDMNYGKDNVPGFTVKIKAEAVQVENLNATTASEAFEEVGWKIGQAYGE